MLRVTTLYASTAAATAGYYTKYLTRAEGEIPGVWAGKQAARFGLSGPVDAERLERLLSGCDPNSGTALGNPLVDRTLADGRVVRAVSGFDATISAPKSLSAWWALTGDQRLLDAHDAAVKAAIDTLQRYGATTRIRSNGARLHPDTEGLTIAAFRQSTSRLDDPQIHTHVVISAKVQLDDGRWFALDARALKKHQRTLGGVYQSVLRAELADRFGVRFGAIVHGQAEIDGMPQELLDVFSKRAAQVDEALAVKEDEFRDREQREPTRFEHAAMQREAAADTRRSKSGSAVPDLRTRWITEAAEVGVTAASLRTDIARAARTPEPEQQMTTGDVERILAERASTWHRLDVLRALTDELRPHAGMTGERWLAFLERCTDEVVSAGVDLDPAVTDNRRRASDGRSLWVEPIAARYTSGAVLAQEEQIVVWSMERQAAAPRPATTVRSTGLDELQADAAAAVAGHDPLVIVVGAAGTGKTTMLARAVEHLAEHRRGMFAAAPTAKAARVLARETGAPADTVAKLIHEWTRPDRPPNPTWNLPSGSTLLIDEAGMLNTGDLHTIAQLADSNDWRVVLLGDPHQLHAVGRGGMFDELCAAGRVNELTHIHRFTEWWEPVASLALRRGDPRAISSYALHDRVAGGTIEQHLATIANRWMAAPVNGQTVAVTATTNDHVDLINRTIQCRRLESGDVTADDTAVGMNGQAIHVGDQIATRRNDRHLRTSSGDMVRNRETWTVTDITNAGDIVARRNDGNDIVTLPAGYVADHVQLGYATTEPGNQGDTHDNALALVTPSTTARGLYVAMTRGRNENTALVVTADPTVEAAVEILGRVLASDRTDRPAIAQRRELANQIPAVMRLPQPGPRCHVPDWWHTRRDDLVDAIRIARRDLDVMEAARGERAVALADMRLEADFAEVALRPYRQERRDIVDSLSQLEAKRLRAASALSASGFFDRRACRTQLAEATAAMGEVRTALASLDKRWKPRREVAYWASRRLEEVGESHQLRDSVDQTRHLPERLAVLTDYLNAFDTWHHWAQGGRITVESAARMVEVFDVPNDRKYNSLADAVRRVSLQPIAEPEAASIAHNHDSPVDFALDL